MNETQIKQIIENQISRLLLSQEQAYIEEDYISVNDISKTITMLISLTMNE